MAVIGQIQTIDDFGKILLEGHIATLDMSLSFTLKENKPKSSANAPDYYVFTKNSQGSETQIGAAWKKTSKKIGAAISEYLSLSFDDPSFPRAMHLKAFENADETWNVVWNRPQQKSEF